MKPVLFGYWRSSATWRVRIGLALKGVDYAYEPVHLVKDGGQQHGEAHVRRNPMHQVPVLRVEHGGDVVDLTQSLAILEFLDETLEGPALLPSDPLQRAHVRRLAEVVNSWIQPLQNLSTLQKVEKEFAADKIKWGHDIIEQGLIALEAMVQGTAGTFMVGDAPSIADCCLIPQLYNARRFGVDLSGMPTLLRIEAACEALEAFQAAHADVQPDAQV